MRDRILIAVLAAGVMALGCDSPAEEPDAGSATTDAGRDAGTPGEDSGTPGEDSGTPAEDSGTPGDDAGTDAGTPAEDAGSTAAPVITRVEWEMAAGCTMFTASDVIVRVVVTDSDTPAGSLSFSGSVPGCTGTINAATATLNCPNAATYPTGSVTVMDLDGNSDSAGFALPPCDTGGVDF